MAKPNSKHQKQKQSASSMGFVAPGSNSRLASLVFGSVIFLALVVGGLIAISGLSGDDAGEPSSDVASAIPTLFPTNVPPTEAPQEAALQQQLRDWVQTVDGVAQVLTLDIDVLGDEPPLVYTELMVNPAVNNPDIPGQLMAKVNEMLNVTEYSDFVVILDDGTQVTEYMFDRATSTWTNTVLAIEAPGS